MTVSTTVVIMASITIPISRIRIDLPMSVKGLATNEDGNHRSNEC